MAVATPEELRELLTQLNDVAKSYNPSPDLVGFKSRVQIIDKAKKIAQTLTAPDELSVYHCQNMTELVAIRTLLHVKALENIPLDGSISLQNLAKATGAQESLLDRMLRLVVGTGFLDQTRSDGGDYVHTKFSKAYILVPGPGKFFQAMYDEYFKSMVVFDDYIKFTGNATEPDEVTKNPYTWRHSQDGKSVWEIMAQYPERIQTFQIGLAGQDAAVPVVGFYDFSKLKTDEEDRIELVDVGGGQGQSLKQILEAHPDLSPSKMVLQDKPDVIEIVKASNLLPDSVTKMGHDFNTEQPVKVKSSSIQTFSTSKLMQSAGARAYYLRRIMHDYSDAANVLILSQLVKAMKRDSLVLIADMVIPARVGEADLPAAVMDNIVFTLGGKERTEKAFREVFDKAGLELVKVWRASVGAGGLVETRLKI